MQVDDIVASAIKEIGSSGLERFWGTISEAYTEKLYWPDAYGVYDEMRRRSPTIRSALNAVSMLATQATWRGEPATDKPPDRRAAEWLDSNLYDMSHTVDDMIEDALSCLWAGWADFEICYKRRNGDAG